MAAEPKVTGLSPMTGPPGTKITVRGDNLGQSSEDIIQLTINGADCLPYLEWKSSKKIVTRCSRLAGRGDVIVTTKSGGTGTCDVQFDCHEQSVGPTDESAVWVDELDYQTPDRERHAMSGLNEDYSMELSSSRFRPHLYLAQNCMNSSLGELDRVRTELQKDLGIKNDPEVITTSSNRAALLKTNLPVIMECLQIIEHLSKVMTMSRDTSIDNIVKQIRQSLSKSHELFDPLLAQKDLVQSIESAMQVFKQNENLFNLPSAIEIAIRTKNYDLVVKEISGVLTRLKTINIDKSMMDKIEKDVTSKVDKLKATIELQLHESCKSTNGSRNIEDVKKLISHLNRLGSPINFDVWTALTEMSGSLTDTLSEKFDYHLRLSKSPDSEPASQKKDKPPQVVQFVQNALNIFQNTYYDILNLGHSYFDPKDEFACKDPPDVKQMRVAEFEEIMIARPITHLCSLLRLALVPDSSKLNKPSPWPQNENERYIDWLKHVLQSVIACHIQLIKVSLPTAACEAIEDFKEFLFELRVKSMQVLFNNATRYNKNLHHKEDWVIEVDDIYGGRTNLPNIFERNVMETLRFANETIFESNIPNEKSILKRVNVQASMKELAHSLMNSFVDSLDNALIEGEELPAEANRALLACYNSERVPSKYMNRLLVTISNCQYTKDVVFQRLQDEFEKLNGLKMDRVFKVCTKKYCDYIIRISDKFCRIKCAELNRSMKESHSKSIDDLQVNLMIVNSQIFLVAPQLVNYLMTTIVNELQKEQNIVQRL